MGRVRALRASLSIVATIALVVMQVPSAAMPAAVPSTARAANGFAAAYSGESAFVAVPRVVGTTSLFSVFYTNTGTAAWSPGSSTQVNLAVCLPDGVTCNVASPNAAWASGWLSSTAYATSTSTVGAGQQGTFTFNVAVPAGTTESFYDFWFGPVLASTGERISADVLKFTVLVYDGNLYTVTSAADAGAGTLRAAITAANGSSGKDTITFALPAMSSIALASPLPDITESVVIDATTVAGYRGQPLVELNGAGAGASASGLHFASGSGASVVRGLAINRFARWGIDVTAGGSSLISGNYIGTDPTGTLARGNGTTGDAGSGGIHVLTPGVVIGTADLFGGNLVSANHGQGIEVGQSDAPSTIVRNNVVGVGATGGPLRNDRNGLYVRSPGATVAANAIRNSGGAGIAIETGSGAYTDNVIQDNAAQGIAMWGSGNTFDRNDIERNKAGGVLMGASGQNTRNNIFRDNIVRDNGSSGLRLVGPTGDATRITDGNTIRRGSIAGHGGSGIMLEAGANAGIAAPAITNVVAVRGILSVSGSAGLNATVDIYADANGEGGTYLGTVTASDGDGTFSKSSGWAVADLTAVLTALAAGAVAITATQTDGVGNTSQFSAVAPAGTISGIARCIFPGAIEGSVTVTLPNATVELYSGTSLVATTTADGTTAAYQFTGIAPGIYTVRFKSSYTVCGSGVTVGAASGATVPTQLAPIDLHNHAWPTAYRLFPRGGGGLGVTVDEHIIRQGQSDWFKFTIKPGAKVIVTLTNLPANYDLTLYKDVSKAYKALTGGNSDLTRLSAEFAPDAFSPDAFSPDAFSPDAFSPDAFSPDAFSPDAFSPDAFSPDAFSPDAFSPDAFSPDAFSPDAYSPDAFSPDAFSPDAFSPDAFSPDAFSPDAYSAETVSPDAFSPDAFSGAQTRSLIAVSAFGGTSGEGVARHTWDNEGDFYVRVRGRNGAFSLASPFHLQVVYLEGTCELVSPITSGAMIGPGATAGKKTIVLTDVGRMAGSASDMTALAAKLQTFVARPEVSGVIVDVAADERVRNANTQADLHRDCPYAKNLVGNEIKRIVDSYRAANPLEYVVIVGGDGVIPFFRLPDQAGLASEKDFAPPVLDDSASQASLKLGYVLGQDRYGSSVEISINDHVLSLPGLAVGRLVETADEAGRMLDAYLSTTSGVVIPQTALVTGYDFVADAATAVRAELQDALGVQPDALIENGDLSPTDPSAWNASQLGAALLGQRHDVSFLAGHFSAGTALAADYTTRLRSTELRDSAVDLTNALIFSEGCHSGYNVVDGDALSLVTPPPDWAQAFAYKKATLVAGTGYQYGETETIEYGERLYLELSRQLHTGAGPIAIGKALVAAKRTYIAQTAQWRGIHEKTVVESTLWGLPMLRFDMPGHRLAATSDTPAFTGLVTVTPKLSTADLQVRSQLAPHTVALNDVSNVTPAYPKGTPVSPAATYSAAIVGGRELTVANPAEPILPLDLRNVTADGLVLRGVGFVGGTYADADNVRPLTAAPATEVRGVRAPFLSEVFYPVRPWNVNYFDALSGGSGFTRIAVMPSQFRSGSADPQVGTRRTFSEMDFQLFYSSYAGPAALLAGPAIDHVAAVPGSSAVHFSMRVTGAPGSIQKAWITYTTTGTGTRQWTSFDLVRDATNSSLWSSDALAGVDPTTIRYIAQAVSVTGVVTLDTNLGAFYTPGPDTVAPDSPKASTLVNLDLPLNATATGTYREGTSVRARLLTKDGSPLPGQTITFGVGSERRRATTGADGYATAKLSLFQTPGTYDLRASFDETSAYLASADSRPFQIDKRSTTLALGPGCTPVQAVLRDTSSPTKPRTLRDQAVLMTITGAGGSQSSMEVTDFAGRAVTAGTGTLPAGAYTVAAAYAMPLGSVILRGDERYEGSSAQASLAIQPSDVSVTYTGGTIVQTTMPLALSASVGTTAARSLAGAIVCFRLRDSTGLVARATSAPVVNGVSTASILAPAPGIYTVEATANGGSQASGFFTTAPASALVAVFDPSTFVTGGGWDLTSAASKGVPTNGAKANFGFNVKYKSANVPTGSLEFKVNDAKLTVRATTIDYLVITGGNAVFTGSAVVNGTAGYAFRVIVNDASPDTFEIRVWKPGAATGATVDDPAYQVSGPIAGGSIQVH